LVTADPQASLVPQSELLPMRKERTKAQLRNEFLSTVAEKCAQAKETLQAKQLRYKLAYDSNVREITAQIVPGDLVYIKTFVAQKELSKTLIFPAAGPFVVTKVSPDRNTMNVQAPEGGVKVAADRIRKCTAPRDLPTGLKFSTLSPGNAKTAEVTK
jgi:hypothetical protein